MSSKKKIDIPDYAIPVDVPDYATPVQDEPEQKYDSLFATPDTVSSKIDNYLEPQQSVGTPAKIEPKPAYTGPTPAAGATFVRGFGQGVTSNWYDEGVARLNTMFPGMNFTVDDLVNYLKGGQLPDRPQKSYDENLAEFRGEVAAGEKANPKTAIAGEVAGIATQALSPVGRAMGPAKGATGLQRLGQVSRMGAVMGGLNASGRSEADNVGDLATDTAEGAATGAVLAPVLDKTLQVGGSAVRKFGQSRAFQAMTGKTPGATATQETADLIAANQGMGSEVDPLFVKDYPNIVKSQALEMGADALEKGVVRPLAGTEGMAQRAQALQSKATDKMVKIGKAVDAALGGKKGYTMGDGIIDYMDEIVKTVHGAEDPLAREAGQKAISTIQKYVNEFTKQAPAQADLFGGAAADEGAATFEKGWRLLKNVQDLAAKEKDPMSKWIYQRFAEGMRSDLAEQTIDHFANREVLNFTPAGDKLGGFVSKEAPDTLSGWVNPTSASREGEAASKMLGAIKPAESAPLTNINLATPFTGTLSAAKDAVMGPRSLSTVASAANAVGKTAQAVNPAMAGQTVKADLSRSAPTKGMKFEGSTLDVVKQKMQADPKSLGKFGPYLDQVMATEGEDGLKRRIMILGMTNPEWQAMMKEAQE